MNRLVEFTLENGKRMMIDANLISEICECNEKNQTIIIMSYFDYDQGEHLSVSMPYDKVKAVLFGAESEDGAERKNCYENVICYENAKPLENCTWAEIAEISKNCWYDKSTERFCTGDATNPVVWFNIGDEKTIELSDGTKIIVQIYGFLHDETESGDKACITFGLKNALPGRAQMNREATNKGGWRDSQMRNVTLAEYFNLFPQEVKEYIVPVRKKTIEGNGSSDIDATIDKLFLFSMPEVFNGNVGPYQQEGETYPIFTDVDSIVKTIGEDDAASPCRWWLRSPDYGNRRAFWSVDWNGWDYDHYADHTGGVVFGFCI